MIDTQIVTLSTDSIKTQIPVTTSEVISKYANIEHRSVLQMIKKYKSDIEEFGWCPFKMQPYKSAGGVQNRPVYSLNEQQATFLITLLNNSDIVVNFKKKLVKAFFTLNQEQFAKNRK